VHVTESSLHFLHLGDVKIHHVQHDVGMGQQEMDVIDDTVDISLRHNFVDGHDIGMTRERIHMNHISNVSSDHISDMLHRLDHRLQPSHEDKLDDSGRRRTNQTRVGCHFRHHHVQHRQDHAFQLGRFRMRRTDRVVGGPLIRLLGKPVGLVREPVGLGVRREIVGLVCEIIGLIRGPIRLIRVPVIGSFRVVIGIISEVIWLIGRRHDRIIVSRFV